MNRCTSAALTGLTALGLAAAALAHDPELEARYRLEEKLNSAWVTENGFTPDFDKALETAAKSKKPIFAFFTLSYMDDAACERVERGVLSTPEFRKFGEGVVLFASIESGLPAKHPDLLREKGGIEAPYFIVMDEAGSVTAKVAGGIDVKGFEQAVKSGAEFAALKKKADKTADEKFQVFLRDMDLGNLKPDAAKERLAAFGDLTEAQTAQAADAMLRLSIATAAAYDGSSLDRSRDAGKVFAEAWAAGREPATDELVRPFFLFILDHAEHVKDVKLFRRALEKLTGRFGDRVDDRDWKSFFEEQARRLARLESPSAEGDEK